MSADLTAVEFYLRGRIRALTHVQRTQDLCARIDDAFQSITYQEIKTFLHNILRRTQLCISTGRGHFQTVVPITLLQLVL